MATTEDAEAAQVIVHGTAAGFAQRIEIGSHHLDADEPAAFDGTDTGASPYDLLLAARDLEPACCALLVVQRDAGANPGFVFVEIDAHHFPLTHSDKIIEQDRLALLRPDKHHPQLCF